MLPLPAKQDLFNRFGGGVVHMGCVTLVPLVEIPVPPAISTLSRLGIGTDVAAMGLGSIASIAWGTASRAQLYPITISSKFVVRAFLWATGGVSLGNFDMGIYDANFSLLRSLGSTPFPPINARRVETIPALTLQPGTYWLTFVVDNTTATLRGVPNASNLDMTIVQVRSSVGAFPLPSAITISSGPNIGYHMLAISEETF